MMKILHGILALSQVLISLIWIQFVLLAFLEINSVSSDPDLLEMQFAYQKLPRNSEKSPHGGSECWTQVNCRNIRRKPVCGTDGRTYPSKCELKRVRKCEKRQVKIHSAGRCPLLKDGRRPSRCLEERRQALFSPGGNSRIRSGMYRYVPECRKDGSFSPVQCHQTAGYCWCVTPDGRPIPGTSIKGTEVSCGMGFQRDSFHQETNSKHRRGVRIKSCTPANRAEFNKNLVSIFAEEYKREHRGNSSFDDSTVIHWKFSQLDDDNDDILRRSDVRVLKKMLKKVVKPRKCAKTFDSYCDLDQNRRIARAEWSVCLGGDLGSVDPPNSMNSNKVCSPEDRSQFNKRLIQTLMNEFNEKVRSPSSNAGSPSQSQSQSEALLNTPERRVITWKFAELDVDRDGRLRRDEIRPLKNHVKESIKPKACAKSLDTHCDINKDSVIMEREWTVCLGVDINNGKGSPADRNNHASSGSGNQGIAAGGRNLSFDIISRLKTTSQSSKGHNSRPVSDEENRDNTDTTLDQEDSILERGCVKARDYFLEMHRADPGAQIFVPECIAGGVYRREQCHNETGFCWCVDPKSGKPIPTTSTMGVMPNCSNVKIREFKGCSYPQRRTFLTKLLDKLTTEMMEYATNGSDTSNILDNNPDWSIEERAVRWKLRTLDKNANEKLERQELKNFKNIIRLKKDLRKCSRNFLRYCDENDDGQITLSEWIDCTGINEQNRNLPYSADPKGINPFTEYLKDQ